MNLEQFMWSLLPIKTRQQPTNAGLRTNFPTQKIGQQKALLNSNRVNQPLSQPNPLSLSMKKDTFIVRLEKGSKYWDMNISYEVPTEKLSAIVNYLEPYRKPKKAPTNLDTV